MKQPDKGPPLMWSARGASIGEKEVAPQTRVDRWLPRVRPWLDRSWRLLGLLALPSYGGNADKLGWNDDGSVIVDGSQHLRTLNRTLGLNLPVDGPKTLDGLILEHLQDIPESGVSVKIAGTPIEVVQAEDRRIKNVRIFRPHAVK